MVAFARPSSAAARWQPAARVGHAVADAYPWVKAAHVISVIAWMAGLLYLPRLFVYHCDAPPGSRRSEMLKVMERRLQRAIMTPAMIATFLFGGWLALIPGVIDWHEGWPHIKGVLVLILASVHMLLSRWRKDFAHDANRHGAKFYRVINEIPTLAMIAIVILVIVKPF